MTSALQPECSFASWYSTFKEDSLKATILPIPDDVTRYLEYDAFVLPLEATKPDESFLDPKWRDDSATGGEEVQRLSLLSPLEKRDNRVSQLR